jgi:hypothetical protein
MLKMLKLTLLPKKSTEGEKLKIKTKSRSLMLKKFKVILKRTL